MTMMMTMMKFVHALNAAVACTGTEKFGNAQIVTIRKKIKIMLLKTGDGSLSYYTIET